MKKKKERDVKIFNTNAKRNELINETNFSISKQINVDLIVTEIKKVKFVLDKQIYLGFPNLDISNRKIYNFWYNCLGLRLGESIWVNYMDTDSFIFTAKFDDFYNEKDDSVERGLDTSNYTVNRPLKASVNKKVLGLMKDELGGLIIEQKYILSNL